MGRIARVVVPGMPHPVTQRGNLRMTTFFCEADYRVSVSAGGMVSAVRGAGLGVLPDAEPCDLILVPSTPEGLSAAVGQVHQRYTRRINFREKWRGYLWQRRFGSFVLDDTEGLVAAIRAATRDET